MYLQKAKDNILQEDIGTSARSIVGDMLNFIREIQNLNNFSSDHTKKSTQFWTETPQAYFWK